MKRPIKNKTNGGDKHCDILHFCINFMFGMRKVVKSDCSRL